MSKLVVGVVELIGAGGTFLARRRAALTPRAEGAPVGPVRDWTPTDYEKQSVGDPLASILLRHADLSDVTGRSDLLDTIAVVVGVGHYGLRALDGEPGGRHENTPAPPANQEGP